MPKAKPRKAAPKKPASKAARKTARVPQQQAGDPDLSKPTATPVDKHQSLEAGKTELAENPGRRSVLTDKGHLVRE